jgi:hypothetical protein
MVPAALAGIGSVRRAGAFLASCGVGRYHRAPVVAQHDGRVNTTDG